MQQHGSQNNYAELSRKKTKGILLNGPYYLKFWKIQTNLEWHKADQRLSRNAGKGRGRGKIINAHEEMMRNWTLKLCTLSRFIISLTVSWKTVQWNDF